MSFNLMDYEIWEQNCVVEHLLDATKDGTIKWSRRSDDSYSCEIADVGSFRISEERPSPQYCENEAFILYLKPLGEKEEFPYCSDSQHCGIEEYPMRDLYDAAVMTCPNKVTLTARRLIRWYDIKNTVRIVSDFSELTGNKAETIRGEILERITSNRHFTSKEVHMLEKAFDDFVSLIKAAPKA